MKKFEDYFMEATFEKDLSEKDALYMRWNHAQQEMLNDLASEIEEIKKKQDYIMENGGVAKDIVIGHTSTQNIWGKEQSLKELYQEPCKNEWTGTIKTGIYCKQCKHPENKEDLSCEHPPQRSCHLCKGPGFNEKTKPKRELECLTCGGDEKDCSCEAKGKLPRWSIPKDQ